MNNDINESILLSIKKLLGIMPDITDFDTDIIMHINTVFSILSQMGVGPKEGFVINSSAETWDLYLSNFINPKIFQDIKTLVYMRVKMIFDPPSSSPLLDSYNKVISELECRVYTLSGGY